MVCGRSLVCLGNGVRVRWYLRATSVRASSGPHSTKRVPLFQRTRKRLLALWVVARALLPFAHIALGLLLVVWGLDPLSLRLIGLGVFVLFWAGWEPMYTIGRFGVYLVDDVARMTTSRLRERND